ncbi:MAG: hypothetical protein MSB12_03620 [Lentisphaeraceae bacterium]|nr:hypothetical protein [Lentisphaeraceae bacterium]
MALPLRGLLAGVLAIALGVGPAQAKTTASAPARAAVLELTGQKATQAPDILFLAPRLTEGVKVYRSALKTLWDAGTTLEHTALSTEEFCAKGPLPVLKAAGYRLLSVQDLTWREACAQIDALLSLRQELRQEDAIAPAPLCIVLVEEATAAELKETLPQLIARDALIFLAPQERTLPLTLFWQDVIWPAHTVVQPIALDHWVPTLAEMVGLPLPAEVAEASILPMLTGVGYQQPLERAAQARTPKSQQLDAKPSTMLCLFRDLPERCPWVPDYTRTRADLKPTERAFFSAALPLPAQAARLLEPVEKPQGIYLRTQQKSLALQLPARVSCVIRVNGLPVVSRWEPAEDDLWRFENPEALPIELFLLLPPGFDPKLAIPCAKPKP